MSGTSHDCGAWQRSHAAPSSPRCTSSWQSAQRVEDFLNLNVRLVWQSVHFARACCPFSGKPVFRWSNLDGSGITFHESALWHSSHANEIFP
jgi:hypothetical protein